MLSAGDPSDGAVYLTFDDGPGEHTLPIADLLEAHDGRGTFFMVGECLRQHQSLAEDLMQRGHAIGNHSLQHRGFSRLTTDEQLREVDATNALISELSGGAGASVGFRPPQGRISPQLLSRLARSGTRVVHWGYDTCDYRLSTREVVRNFERRPVQAGDIVLFHDDHAGCVDALEQQLPRWKQAGLKFSALPAWRLNGRAAA